MSSTPQDRRNARSQNLHQAMELLLDATCRNFRLSHLVITDSSGLRQASAGSESDCHALAAYAPMLDRAIDPSTRRTLQDSLLQYVPAASPERVGVRRVAIEGREMYVAGVGDQDALREVGMQRVLAGVQRILAA